MSAGSSVCASGILPSACCKSLPALVQVQKQLTQLVECNVDLQQQLDKASATVTRLSDLLERRDAELQSLQEQCYNSTAVQQQSEQDIASLKEQLKHCTSIQQEGDRNIQLLKEQLEQSSVLLQGDAREVESLKASLEEAQQSLVALADEHERLCMAHACAGEQGKARVEQLEAAEVAAGEGAAALSAQVAALQAQATVLEKELQEARADADSVRAAHAEASGEMGRRMCELRGENDAMAQALQDVANQGDAEKAGRLAAEGEVLRLKQHVHLLQGDLELKLTELEHASTSAREMDQAIGAKEDVIAALRQRLELADEDIAALKERLAAVHETTVFVRDQLDSLQIEYNAVNQAYKAVRSSHL